MPTNGSRHALKHEIADLIATVPAENGFYVNRRFMWMGRWIRARLLPVLDSPAVSATARAAVRTAPSTNSSSWRVQPGYLSNDLIHEDRRGIGDWIAKHNRYASREALELARTEQERRSNELDARLMGSQAERKRWIRRHVWNRLPPLRQAGCVFLLSLCAALRLSGRRPGLHVFTSCRRSGIPMLIDIKYLELRASEARQRQRGSGCSDARGHESARLQRDQGYDVPITDRLVQVHDFWNAGSCGEDRYRNVGIRPATRRTAGDGMSSSPISRRSPTPPPRVAVMS